MEQSQVGRECAAREASEASDEDRDATPALRVGFVGLGDMGGPIARHLGNSEFHLTVWSRRDASRNQLDAGTYAVAESLVDLGRSSDVVGVCVFGDSDLREVTLGPHGVLAGMGPESILVIHSTVSVEVCLEINSVAASLGVHVLDAPVSGAREGAQRGDLTIMVGGPDKAVQRALPAMRTYGGLIRRMGEVGTGQRMKVLNNVLGFATGRIANLAIEAGVELGLDGDAVTDVLSSGSAGSSALNSLVEKLIPSADYTRHARSMVEKDTLLYLSMCRDLGVSPGVLGTLATERIDNMIPRIGGDAPGP